MFQAIENICKLLSARKVTLFLGAGVNAGLRNSKGDEFPLGQGLAKLICRDLLSDPLLDLTLDEAGEFARRRFGPSALNKYLFDFFSTFSPASVHDAILQLPWDTIYTTNFDLLLEQAEERLGVGIARRLVPIVSVTTDLGTLQEEDIPYYKLHGSLDLANTDEGQLTLTKEDYRRYEELRKPLFKRLQSELGGKSFVFLGYAMLDPNFREILEECRAALGVRTLPLSYAIRPNFRAAEVSSGTAGYMVCRGPYSAPPGAARSPRDI
jgi:hypothetical protein